MGTIPSTFSSLSLLHSMDLSTNSLSGTLPEYISTFSNLHILRLDHNKFQGSLPSSWDAPQLPNLIIFSLSHNALSGSIQPNTWGRFTHLSILDFSFNSFTGITPEGLKYAQNMRKFTPLFAWLLLSQRLHHLITISIVCIFRITLNQLQFFYWISRCDLFLQSCSFLDSRLFVYQDGNHLY